MAIPGLGTSAYTLLIYLSGQMTSSPDKRRALGLHDVLVGGETIFYGEHPPAGLLRIYVGSSSSSCSVHSKGNRNVTAVPLLDFVLLSSSSMCCWRRHVTRKSCHRCAPLQGCTHRLGQCLHMRSLFSCQGSAPCEGTGLEYSAMRDGLRFV